MRGRLVLNGSTEIRGSFGEISSAHVSEATALWLQTMVPLGAGDSVALQGSFRAFEAFFEPVVNFVRYLPVSAINQVEKLFQRFGYGVIIANRFLAGTRAIVSFVAGMSRMNLMTTTLLSALSAAAWNAILLYLGMAFGKNWQRVGQYLSIYSSVVTAIVVILLAVFIWRYIRNKRQTEAASAAND